MSDIRSEIEAEIYHACLRLGAEPERAAQIIRAPHSYIYRACGQLGAGTELLSILGSYGDTLSDADVLDFLKIYNTGKPIISNVICSVEDETPRLLKQPRGS